jgi:hypothetical protein
LVNWQPQRPECSVVAQTTGRKNKLTAVVVETVGLKQISLGQKKREKKGNWREKTKTI